MAMTFAIQAIVKPVPNFLVAQHMMLAFAVIPGFAMGAAYNRLYQRAPTNGRARRRDTSPTP